MTDGPWLPTYLEIISEPSEYYQKFGFEHISIPTDCPLVSSLKPWMDTLFLERYAFRRINRETLEQWQVALQRRFDFGVHKLEHSLALYDEHADRLLEVFHTDVETRTATTEGTANSSSVSSGRDSFHDTPDSTVNVSDTYNNGMTKRSVTQSGTTGNTLSLTETKTREYIDDPIGQIDNAVDQWRDLVSEFIAGFEDSFLNIFWY